MEGRRWRAEAGMRHARGRRRHQKRIAAGELACRSRLVEAAGQRQRHRAPAVAPLAPASSGPRRRACCRYLRSDDSQHLRRKRERAGVGRTLAKGAFGDGGNRDTAGAIAQVLAPAVERHRGRLGVRDSCGCQEGPDQQHEHHRRPDAHWRRHAGQGQEAAADGRAGNNGHAVQHRHRRRGLLHHVGHIQLYHRWRQRCALNQCRPPRPRHCWDVTRQSRGRTN
eukprot:scaffold15154_cov100-Isochrysis_galbana.AAC.1